MARGARRRATPEAPPGGPCADPGNPRGLPKPVCLNRCFFFYPPGRDRSVSYTHLTLPTILLV
eukprot:1404731-Pyramimonas_sp.AAC.1